MSEGEWLTVKEIAAMYDVDRTTVVAWIQRGELPAFRLAGRGYRIRPADARALLVPVEPGEVVPTRHQRGVEVERAVQALRARGLKVPD